MNSLQRTLKTLSGVPYRCSFHTPGSMKPGSGCNCPLVLRNCSNTYPVIGWQQENYRITNQVQLKLWWLTVFWTTTICYNNDDVRINYTIIIIIISVLSKLVVKCSESIKCLNKYVLFVFSVSNLAQIMIALAIFGSYPLQCYVGLEIIWGNYIVHWIKNCNKDCLIEYALRTSFVVLSCKFMTLS